MSRRRTTISNNLLSLSVDARGRIVSLRNKETDTELIDFPEASEAWRMVVPDGRHTLTFVLGSSWPRPPAPPHTLSDPAFPHQHKDCPLSVNGVASSHPRRPFNR